jgi:hypothetical protein
MPTYNIHLYIRPGLPASHTFVLLSAPWARGKRILWQDLRPWLAKHGIKREPKPGSRDPRDETQITLTDDLAFALKMRFG